MQQDNELNSAQQQIIEKIRSQRAQRPAQYLSEEQAARRIQQFWRVKKFLSNPHIDQAENLTAINKSLDARNISINLAANPQTVDHKNINMAAAEITLNRFRETKYADFLRHFLQNYVTHISFRHFMQALKESCAVFNKWLLANPELQNYTILYQANKSQQWVASLALRYLYLLPRHDVNFKMNQDPGLKHLTQDVNCRQNKTFVMFDDNTLSGQQIYSQVLDKFFEAFSIKNCQINEPCDIYLVLVVPFVTTKALNKINAELTFLRTQYANDNVRIHIKMISTRLIPLMSQLPLSAENAQLLMDVMSTPYVEPEILMRKPVVYSDWKLPDEISIPALFHGYISGLFDKYSGRPLNQVPNRVSMLPETAPPYKLGFKPMFTRDKQQERQLNTLIGKTI